MKDEGLNYGLFSVVMSNSSIPFGDRYNLMLDFFRLDMSRPKARCLNCGHEFVLTETNSIFCYQCEANLDIDEPEMCCLSY